VFLDDAGVKTTYVKLNIDDIRPQVGTQEAARKVFVQLIDKTIEDGYSFLYDGTCRDRKNTVMRIKEAKEKGYTIILGITYASLGTVLNRIRKRVNQPLDDELVRDIYAHLKRNVETYMSVGDIDELYLYNNEKSTKLIFYKDNKKVMCVSPDSQFYFDVSKYC
jgi:predicted ABC-type ATPase